MLYYVVVFFVLLFIIFCTIFIIFCTIFIIFFTMLYYIVYYVVLYFVLCCTIICTISIVLYFSIEIHYGPLGALFGSRTNQSDRCALGLGEFIHTVRFSFVQFKCRGLTLITNRKTCGYYGSTLPGDVMTRTGKKLLYVEGLQGTYIHKLKIHFEC